MAKGRKIVSDRRDRLLGTHGGVSGNYSTGGGEFQELCEEDVWDTAGSSWSERTLEELRPHRWTTGREDRQAGGLSQAFEEGYQPARQTTVVHQYHHNVESHRHNNAASAPVNVPDWGRFLRADSAESLQSDVDDGEWVPPHEYLAREHGRMATTSVFEGVGRTLKGRDMSRVRDAVWNQTGFFG